MSSLRIVIDSNVFGEGNFDALDASPIRTLVKRKKVQLIYGDVFLEELISAYDNDHRRSILLDRWLPFINETCSVVGEELETIWHQELVLGKRSNARVFMSKKRSQHLLEKFLSAEPDGSWQIASETITARSDITQRKVELRKRRVNLRESVANGFIVSSSQHLGTVRPEFYEFRNQYLAAAGRKFIESDISSSDPIAIATRWARSPLRYPYFTQFVVNHLYCVWSCAWVPDQKIDVNAQQDLDIMTHLRRADILVTNERRFMRTAFDDLWRPQGKVVLDSEEFVDSLKKLV